MELLATVNINLGKGIKNPSLKITKETNIPQMIKEFVREYKLPQET